MGEFHKGGLISPGLYPMNCNITKPLENEEDKKCLEERKYWCFLLSSIVTFCSSMLLVVIWRIVVHVCCRPKEAPEVVVDDGNADDDKFAKNGRHIGDLQEDKQALALADGPPQQAEEVQIGWMTEAKDWAGELISGQSATGRILVSAYTRSESEGESRGGSLIRGSPAVIRSEIGLPQVYIDGPDLIPGIRSPAPRSMNSQAQASATTTIPCD